MYRELVAIYFLAVSCSVLVFSGDFVMAFIIKINTTNDDKLLF